MHLRSLNVDDAPLMLEWMHDEEIAENFLCDFRKKTLADCLNFIEKSRTTAETTDNHFAVADEGDQYMGTVSLKNIHDGEAEFAIAMRRQAFGKGYASYGMRTVLEYGFLELRLKKIWWTVYENNHRAIRFYDKNGWANMKTSKILGGGYDNNICGGKSSSGYLCIVTCKEFEKHLHEKRLAWKARDFNHS